VLTKVGKTLAGCWVWLGPRAYGPRQKRSPYGYLQVGARRIQVRRLTYVLWGRRPPLRDYVLDSTCGNSLCVNPAHLVRSRRRKGGRPPANGGP
jgi:hypothetical protein